MSFWLSPACWCRHFADKSVNLNDGIVVFWGDSTLVKCRLRYPRNSRCYKLYVTPSSRTHFQLPELL